MKDFLLLIGASRESVQLFISLTTVDPALLPIWGVTDHQQSRKEVADDEQFGYGWSSCPVSAGPHSSSPALTWGTRFSSPGDGGAAVTDSLTHSKEFEQSVPIALQHSPLSHRKVSQTKALLPPVSFRNVQEQRLPLRLLLRLFHWM